MSHKGSRFGEGLFPSPQVALLGLNLKFRIPSFACVEWQPRERPRHACWSEYDRGIKSRPLASSSMV
jgi:hypothetical protein